MLGNTRAWNIGGGPRETAMWKTVWGMEGPNKMKHFVWNACKGSLAVKEQLYYRHISHDNVCQICGEEETIIHSLFFCKHALEIWNHSELRDEIQAAPQTSFADLFLWMAEKLNTDDLRRFATLAWAAWLCRNKEIFEMSSPSPVHVAAGFCKLVEDTRQCEQRVRTNLHLYHPLPSTVSWNKPHLNWVKVNVDAYVGENRTVGLGVVVRDWQGKLLVAAATRMNVAWEARMAEAAAARFGVMIARRYGYSKVCLEGDALSVMAALHQHHVGRAPISLLLSDVISLSQGFEVFLL